MNRKLTALAVVACVCLATASTLGATSAGQLCRSFKEGAHSYRSETLGTGWTCASARAWIVKLSGDHVHITSANVPLTNGPRGYHCSANLASRGGRATAGQCFKGTVAFPGPGFAWSAA